MDTFSYYKEGIDCLNVPDYSIEQVSSAKRHKKYIQKKKIQKWVSIFIFILLSGIMVSTTAYAAYTIHKRIRFTSQGIRIDAVDLQKVQENVLYHEYTIGEENQQKPFDRQDDFMDTSVAVLDAGKEIKYFNTWEKVLKEIDFPVVYPENISYTELEIVYTPGNDFKNIEATYLCEERTFTVSYTYFLGQNWEYATDYNAVITDQSVYTNQYNNTFWIVECQRDEGRQINVTAKSNQYVLQLSFLGYEIEEVHEVLNKFNLA